LIGMMTVLAVLLLTAKRENSIRYTGSDMEHASSRRVWEYVSDFSNMVHLNPTM
jgi:UDP-galactopyranose mutase